MPWSQEYERTAREIAAYLAKRQRPDGSFPGPDHYGVASALWLWSHFGTDYAPQINRVWKRLNADPPSTHGEFNIYALLHCRERLGENAVDTLIRRLRPGHRHSANWILLRSVCHSFPGPYQSRLRAQIEGRAALFWHSRNGFIEDRPGVKSFAYHAFCGALLADLWRLHGFSWAGRAAVEAASAIAPFILPNGDTLYVGRGQQQIFGYGALIYLFQAVSEMKGEGEYGALAERVFSHVMRFQRLDGSFPLVLHEGEEPEPWQPDFSRPGWYSYNRYADYMPFFGCMLLKAAEIAATGRACVGDGLREGRQCRVGLTNPAHRLRSKLGLHIITMPRYSAVLGPPGSGPPTNDLCFPYVCVDGEPLFPCYGREGKSIEPSEAPLPYGTLADGTVVSFRDRLCYRLTAVGQEHAPALQLIGISSLVRHERTFTFGEAGFECTDTITFLRDYSWSRFVPANFLFRTLQPTGNYYETWHKKARTHIIMEPHGLIHRNAATTASGRLAALRHEVEAFEAAPGQQFITRLTVEFL